jgi:pyrimidine-specific ribonucleoside hydrolase
VAHRILLDVDTGIDDAMAILFAVAHPDVEVLGIGCVAGNAPLPQVVANTLRVLDAADAPPIPVAAGAARPLIEPARPSHVHGEDGLGGLDLPPSDRPVDPRHSVDLFRDLILEAAADGGGRATIVALAPQTNIALLLHQHPEVADALERIVFMGGSASGGNATAVAEFNVWQDPEAAAIVVGSGVPTSMYGLDVFNAVDMPETERDRLAASDRRAERVVGELLTHPMADPSPDNPDGYSGHIGDAGAVVMLVDPDALLTRVHPVRVELEGASRGQTVVDRRIRAGEDAVHGSSAAAQPVEVALGVDAARVNRVFLDAIALLP